MFSSWGAYGQVLAPISDDREYSTDVIGNRDHDSVAFRLGVEKS